VTNGVVSDANGENDDGSDGALPSGVDTSGLRTSPDLACDTAARVSPGDASASGSIAAAAAGAEPVVAPSGVATDSARTVPPQVPNPGYCANDGRAAAVRPRKRKLNFDVDFNARRAAMDRAAIPEADDGSTDASADGSLVTGAHLNVRPTEGHGGPWKHCRLVRHIDADHLPGESEWVIQEVGSHRHGRLLVTVAIEKSGPRNGKCRWDDADCDEVGGHSTSCSGGEGATAAQAGIDDSWHNVLAWPDPLIDVSVNGFINLDGQSLSADEKMTAGCANLLRTKYGGGIAKDDSAVLLHARHGELMSGMRDPRMFEQLFPSLFVLNDGGPGSESEAAAQMWGQTEPRPRRATTSSFDADARRMLLHSSGAFDEHKAFLSTVFSFRSRAQLLRSVRFRSPVPTSVVPMQDMVHEFEDLVSHGGRAPAGSNAAMLRRKFQSIDSVVEGSPFHRQARQGPMYALAMHFGCAHFFVTVNLAPVHDMRISIAAEEPMFHWTQWRQPKTWPSQDSRLRLIAERPALTAIFSARIFTAYHEALLGWMGRDPTLPPEGRNWVNGLYKQVQAFAGTIETQERGTLHQHIQLWVTDMVVQWLRARLQDTAAQTALFEYLDSVVDCCMPPLLRKWHADKGGKAGEYQKKVTEASPAGQPDDQWRQEHRIESFPHTADVKNMPPPDSALRRFDPVRFDSELETRRTLSVVSGCLHEHYGKCQRQVDGKPVCKDRFKRACYTAEERANRANGMSAAPVASECENSTESRVPLAVGIMRPEALGSFQRVGTWDNVDTLCAIDDCRAKWDKMRSSAKYISAARDAASVVLALVTGNSLQVCGGQVPAPGTTPRSIWEEVLPLVQVAMKQWLDRLALFDGVEQAGAINRRWIDVLVPLIDTDWCRRVYEGSSEKRRRLATIEANVWAEVADDMRTGPVSRVSLVDLRDSHWRVPTNPAVSTVIPFNASVEVLTDGVIASHKTHYSTKYSTKMGITDSSIGKLVLNAMRKQLLKPDADDLDAAQEWRRMQSSALMAINGSMVLPAQMMATYLLELPDFYVSHDFVDVWHYNFFPPYRKRPVCAEGDASGSDEESAREDQVGSGGMADTDDGVNKVVSMQLDAPDDHASDTDSACHDDPDSGSASIDTAPMLTDDDNDHPDDGSSGSAQKMDTSDEDDIDMDLSDNEPVALAADTHVSADGGDQPDDDDYQGSATWQCKGGEFVLVQRGGRYMQRCAPAMVTPDTVLWARDDSGIGQLKRMGVLAYAVSVRDSDHITKQSMDYYVAPGQLPQVVVGHTQVPAVKRCIPCIRPHEAYTGRKQPRLWRSVWAELRRAYPTPCAFASSVCVPGLPCGCYADEQETSNGGMGSFASHLSAKVQTIVRRLYDRAGREERHQLEEYCLFWYTYLVPWIGQSPPLRDDEKAFYWVHLYFVAHLQWHRHRRLLWNGMQLVFRFDGNDAVSAATVTSGDLVVIRDNRLGIVRCSIDANSVEVEMLTVEQASRHRYRRSGHIKAIALDHVYGHLHDWEFDLRRARTDLQQLDRDGMLSELHEAMVSDAEVLAIAHGSDNNDDELRDLLWLAFHYDVAVSKSQGRTRSGRQSRSADTYYAAPATRNNTQDQPVRLPVSVTQVRRTAWARVQSLRPPSRGRVLAVIDEDALAYATSARTDAPEAHPLPYWLAVCQDDVTHEQWLGNGTFVVRYLEHPRPVYVDGDSGAIKGWEYQSLNGDNTDMPRANIICQLPELDKSPQTLRQSDDGAYVPTNSDETISVMLSTELHQRCYDATCRHTNIHLRVDLPVETADNDVDLRGQYRVQCTQDVDTGSAVSLRSQGVSSKPLHGATLQLRVSSVRLAVWPCHMPASTQPAVLTLPGGARAHGTICALPSDTDDMSTISFEASIGRGMHAYRNLRQVDNIHGLNGIESTKAEKERIEQNRRDLNAQNLHDTADMGYLAEDKADDDNDDESMETIEATVRQFTSHIRDDAQSKVSPLTQRALTGLKNAEQCTWNGHDTATDIACHDVSSNHNATNSAALIVTPRDRAQQDAYDAYAKSFERTLKAANTQSGQLGAHGTSDEAESATQPPPTVPPPLVPGPPDGSRTVAPNLTSARPTLPNMTLDQTLSTGAPDVAARTPFGKPVNTKQGEAIANILSMLGLGGSVSARVGTAPMSGVFAGVEKLYYVAGEPGTGKSVVLNAVRRHLLSHGWTHDQFRVLAAMGKAAAHVHGGTFASFAKQAGNRKPLKKGEKRPPRPPGVQPVFDPAQKTRLSARNGRLKLIMIDEYEMVSARSSALYSRARRFGLCTHIAA
jgi:hypothetical protein